MHVQLCIRTLAVVSVTLCGCLGNPSQAQAPAAPAPQASPTNPVSSTQPQATKPTPPPPGNDKMPPLPAGQMPTPAQVKYGLPRTPQAGVAADTDLSKPLTLQRAIAIGLLRQNSIAIAQTQADAAQAQLVQARSSYYPQITPSFQYNTTLTPGGTVFVNGQPFAGSRTSETRTEVLAGRQLIFDSGRREASVGLARRSLFATRYGLGNQRQDVVLLVTQGYFNLLRERELIRVEQESVRRAQETLDAITAEVKAGVAAQSDTLQAQSDLANARVSLLSVQNDYQTTEASLKNAMGVVTSQPVILEDSQIVAPDTTPDAIPLERYIQTAYANRLDVKQQQERVYAQGYNVRIAHINNGLSFEAQILEGYQLNPNAGEERSFNVSATYPLFDGGASRAVVQQTKAQWEQEKRTLDQLQQNVRLTVDQSYATREIAKRRLDAANVAVAAGQQNRDVALAKQKNGLINILEVINAEVLLVTAQVQQVQAIYDYYIAYAQLQREIGLNDSTFLPNVPKVQPPVRPTP